MVIKKNLLHLALFMAFPGLSIAADIEQADTLRDALTDGKVSANFRLRYENVNQAGQAHDANAYTLRSLIGYETKAFHGFSVNTEIYGVSPFNDDYNDLKKGDPIASRTQYPVIADPEDYDFHQLYLQWANASNQVKLGRQGMILDDWRFIGDVRFRQNWQVFNGISWLNQAISQTDISLAHYAQVKQISTKIQNADIDIANVKYKFSPTTSLTGYGYLVDWDGKALAATSTKTFGARLDGSQKMDDHWKVLYTAEYAKQDDYKDGSALIDNYYYRVGAGAGYDNWFLRLDQEKLSGNSDNKAFQTPLGTNHLFQGWADVFLTTPNQGIEDTMLIAGGKVFNTLLKAEYHFINADRDFNQVGGGQGDSYGKELDLGAYYKFNKALTGSLEYASFKEGDQYAGARKRSVDKVWLTAIYTDRKSVV